MIAQKITLTPVTPGAPTYIQATRGENNARALRFTVIGADNKPIDLTGCTVVFYVDRTKEEKGVVQVGAVVNEDNTATVTLPSGTCAASGEWGCWVQVINPNVYDLRADNLILRVQPCGIDEEGEASSEFTLLTQLIVEAEKVIDELYAAMPYNPNLLDNWYFVRAVNQRGQTSYTKNGYTIDRWYVTNGEVKVEETGTSLTLNNGGSLVQYMEEDFTPYHGNKVTVSALINGQLYQGTGEVPGSIPAGYETYARVDISDTLYLRFLYSPAKSGFQVNLSSSADGNEIKIDGMKLEFGSSSTLAYQKAGKYIMNDSINYQQELAKCQRYFYRLGAAEGAAMVGQGSAGGGTTAIYFLLYTPVSMQIRPTLSLSKIGCMTITKTTFSAGNASTGIQLTAGDKLNQLLTLIVQAAGLDATGIFRAWLNPGEYLDFSADL